MTFIDKKIPFTLAIVLSILIGATSFADVQIPNAGFEISEVFEPANWYAGDACIPNSTSQTVTRPEDWESWYDDWCDAGKSDYCEPCRYMNCGVADEGYTGDHAMMIGAANRIGWFEGTAVIYIEHDRQKLPNKLSGYYKKPSILEPTDAHYLDPQIFFLDKRINMLNFENCAPGMLTGCNLEDPELLLVGIYKLAVGGEEILLRAQNEWTYWEREIPELSAEDAANVGTIVIRFRHIAASESEFAYVDDLAFEFPADAPVTLTDTDPDLGTDDGNCNP